MTKKTETAAVEETVTSAGLEVANQPNDHWIRSSALEQAITFHKNNGGMTQPNLVVGTATIFLNFIQGESK
jgi:hypothetical protein